MRFNFGNPVVRCVFRTLGPTLFAIATICSAVIPQNDRWRLCFLSIISGVIGFLLKLGPFGFARCFVQVWEDFDCANLAHLVHVMFWSTIFVGTISELCTDISPLFFPDHPRGTFVTHTFPFGISVALGSYIVGLGIPLASACATGTFVGIGEGSLKSLAVIIWFVAGTTVGVTDPIFKIWKDLPRTKEPVDLGWYMVPLCLLFLTCSLILLYFQRRREHQRDAFNDTSLMTMNTESEIDVLVLHRRRWWEWFVDIVIAACIGAYYLCVGETIGVVSAFPLAGCKFLSLFGVKAGDWLYWEGNGESWRNGMTGNPMFWSNIFFVAGSFLASCVIGAFGMKKTTWMDLAKGSLSGFIMGFGGSMANGCTIGSMVTGVNAGSIHGWLWLFCAMAGSGTYIGIRKFVESRREVTAEGYEPLW